MNNNFPIVLVHQNSKCPVGVITNDGTKLSLKSKTCSQALWELASRFPENWIGWCEKDLQNCINLHQWDEIFHHNLIMASYAVKTTFLQDSIGYVDHLPFVSVNRSVQYATWQMSSDMGGIKGAVLLKFKPLLGEIKDLDYLLNSVAKIGQQNSLFCYSSPKLYKKTAEAPERKRNAALPPKPVGSTAGLFAFISQHYKSGWTSVLLLHFLLYERSLPLFAFLTSFFMKKFFRKTVDLSDITIKSRKEKEVKTAIDVIIPTMDRREYLYDVLCDFSVQTHLPERIIIVEQNPEKGSMSELNYLMEEQWPFKIEHYFTHRTGACNARNIALKKASSEWIFFADDDIRFSENLLEQVLEEAEKYNFCAVNINCKQPGEKTVFKKMKQWGTFGSGTSIVKTEFARQCHFSIVYEHGFGEDMDYGMQLRNLGCDIIYHPDIQIVHLKAPQGGFRYRHKRPWDEEILHPKPSPTMMAFVQRYLNLYQFRGYKTSLFIRTYWAESIKNPFKYLRVMKQRWKISKYWSNKLTRET